MRHKESKVFDLISNCIALFYSFLSFIFTIFYQAGLNSLFKFRKTKIHKIL